MENCMETMEISCCLFQQEHANILQKRQHHWRMPQESIQRHHINVNTTSWIRYDHTYSPSKSYKALPLDAIVSLETLGIILKQSSSATLAVAGWGPRCGWLDAQTPWGNHSRNLVIEAWKELPVDHHKMLEQNATPVPVTVSAKTRWTYYGSSIGTMRVLGHPYRTKPWWCAHDQGGLGNQRIGRFWKSNR